MKKWLKIFLIALGAIFIVSFVWFDLFFWQGNNKNFEQNLTSAAEKNNVIIIFNSGGFGIVHPERAWDFEPIIKGIQSVAESMGYSVAVVPYYRTEDSILGKAAYFKEGVLGFPKESKYLASELEKFSKQNPQKKIIMAGLSNGAAFADATMEKINCCENNILALEFGPPFWVKNQNKHNILYFNNNGRDSFSEGNVSVLLWSTVKAPFIMVYTKIIGRPISYPEAMSVPGHQYVWQDVGPQVATFLSNNLSQNQ